MFHSVYFEHRLFLYGLLISLFLLPAPVSAAGQINLKAALLERAGQLKLWQKLEWLNLLHYNKEGGIYVSQVDDERFFYAADGHRNPKSELLATLENLFIEHDNHNQQTQCRFVARTRWLTDQLGISPMALPAVHCDEYLEWRQMVQADSVTLIFPAYHLNSPSSMFGHTLLRLDSSQGTKTDWLAYAVNFGADIDNSDNSLLYAYRGLAGGYPGIFISEPYFKKIQEYNRIEHRDIWEYQLNLTAHETRRMIEHLWELKTINFDYYFFDENCSYRLLELIEVARPGIELTDEFVLTAIPVDTVRAIDEAGLVESVSYRPARATEIQHILDDLSDRQRDVVLSLSRNIRVLDSEAFKALSTRQQKVTIDLAYKYLRYLNTKTARDPEISKRSFELLKELNTYPVEIDISNPVPAPSPPEKGHGSKRVTAGSGQRLDNNYVELGFKMAFHDLEDSKLGFLQGAQINMSSIKLRAIENVGLRLYQLDIIDIFSLTPKNRFFDPLSWKVYSGFERQLTRDKDQLVYHLSGGAGKTWEIVKNHQFHALAIGRLEINKQLKNHLEPAIGFNTGFLSHFSRSTAYLEFSAEQFEDQIYRIRAQYTQNFVLSTNHSIKLFAKHQWQDNDIDFSDINLSYQYYF